MVHTRSGAHYAGFQGVNMIEWLGAISTEPELLAIPGLPKTTSEFRWKLWEMGQRLQIDPSYIAAVMSLESGFNPANTNPNTRATGLIQFMPSTARALGTTVDALRGMSAVEQLPYVERYYSKYRGRLHTPGQVYMITFMPKYAFSSRDTVIARQGSNVYDQNRGLDVNKDGVLTVGDVMSKVEAVVARAGGSVPVSPVKGRFPGWFNVAVLGTGAFFAIWITRKR